MRCFYCMPDESYAFSPQHRLMQAHEVFTLAETFTQMGVKKIRLTGGEPLVRKDAGAIIRSLSTLPVELTLTTNATRIHEFLNVIAEGGITSINVSLDTLQRERFRTISRRDLFDTVYANIETLIRMGIHTKVNMVVVKGLNDDELPDFVRWTREEPVHVRFIEFMPFENNRWAAEKVVTWQQMLEAIGERFPVVPLPPKKNDTARGYRVPGHAGTFSVISTMSAPFCSTCNRLRLTADGKFKNCLFSQEEFDLLGALRKGSDVKEVIMKGIARKAKETGGQLSPSFERLEAGLLNNRSMIRIGG